MNSKSHQWMLQSALLGLNTNVRVRYCNDAWALELQHDAGWAPLNRSNDSDKIYWRLCSNVGSRIKGHVGEGAVFCPHRKLCTPDAVRSPAVLACLLCAPTQHLDRLRRAMGSLYTQLPFMQRVNDVLAPSVWVWECKCVPGWHGCLDLALPGLRLVVQVDGRQHFAGEMFGKAACEQVERDVRCMQAAASSRWTLLRLHHRDLGDRGMDLFLFTIQHITRNPSACVLLLSRSYGSLLLPTGGSSEPYTARARRAVGGNPTVVQGQPAGTLMLTL